MMQSIAIAFSGGVDSTAAALFLKKNYRVIGFFMDIGQPDFLIQKQKVVELCDQIGIDFQVIDLKEQFNKDVVDYFSDSYFSGKTPNPCMICNHRIKFGRFMDAIFDTGLDQIATGHYARKEIINNEAALMTGADPRKDQSYFLSRLTQKQLSRVVFPLGNKHKKEIYSFVENQGFTCFKGKESQDICFLKGSDITSFLDKINNTPLRPGKIVSTRGETIGNHNGLHRYTIGQRRGLGLPDTTPWYVCSLNTEDNILVVGKQEDLFASKILVTAPHWLTTNKPRNGQTFLVRLRYSHRGARASIEHIDENSFHLIFDDKQRAIAPGQFAVLYDNGRVIGSGEIYRQL